MGVGKRDGESVRGGSISLGAFTKRGGTQLLAKGRSHAFLVLFDDP